MIFPGFPGVLSLFQVFQVEWQPCNHYGPQNAKYGYQKSIGRNISVLKVSYRY